MTKKERQKFDGMKLENPLLDLTLAASWGYEQQTKHAKDQWPTAPGKFANLLKPSTVGDIGKKD